MIVKKIDDVKVGDDLPALDIELTPRLIVGAAIASRDYQNVHHDKSGAQDLGSPDIFMNILTTNGLVGRYVTDWAGPHAFLKKVAIRLGAPNYPGDNMKLTGTIISANQDEKVIEIDIKGKNSIGYHVTGTVSVMLDYN
tara:strand:- start:1157 stop:1573 length:417 start_codon:yes stop_codon:yes gene_type:complete